MASILQLPKLRPSPVSEEHRQRLISEATSLQLGRWQNIYDLVTSAPLLLGDAAAALLSTLILVVMAKLGWLFLPSAIGFALGTVGFTVLLQHIHGLYPACGLQHSVEFGRCLRTSLIAVLAVALGWLCQLPEQPFPYVGLFALGCVLPVMLIAVRALLRATLTSCDWWAQPVMVIGDGPASRQAFELLSRCRSEGLRPIGIAFESELPWSERNVGEHFIGPVSQLGFLLRQCRTCRVLLASRSVEQSMEFLNYQGIPHVSVLTDLNHHATECIRLNNRNGVTELHSYNAITAPYARLAKRALDVGLILAALPALVPVFLVLMTLVRFSSPGPIFYGSRRIGLGGKVYRAWKFRSMVVNGRQVLEEHFKQYPQDRELLERNHKLKNDPRVTAIGRFLRKSSLDELPQLWNVLCGEMSLVGPRPILEDERIKYGFVYDLYITVRPGITGLWQVSGRNNLEYEARLRFTRFYIQNWSCTFDLYILWRTIKTALFQEGAC